jgi:TolB-like protein/tetratricopeptide (TPR) repeat protein
MSPEQAAGRPIDARSDVFSFGLVLYEALSGKRAFSGSSDLDVLHAIAYQPVASLPSSIPQRLRTIAEKALEKNPADRFQSMQEMVVDFRSLLRGPIDEIANSSRSSQAAPTSRAVRVRFAATTVAILVVASAGMWLWTRQPIPFTSAPPATSALEIRALAVLPLQSKSTQQVQDFFADGIQEALTAELSRIGIKKVVAKSSADAFKGTSKSPAEIGRELGVDALLIGSVERSASRVDLTTQLVSAANAALMWSKRYQSTTQELVKLENEVVSDVATQLRATITPEQRTRLASARRIDPAAYDEYLKARAMFAGFAGGPNPKLLAAVIAQYERAIQADPSYAPSYAGLSTTYQAASQGSWLAPKDAFPKARAAALKAVELDEQLALTHAALAGAYLWYDWNWREAERELKRALELNPDSVDALTVSEQYSALISGNADDAARASQRIIELDPLNPFSRVQPAWVAINTRRFDDAVAKAKTLIQVMPGNVMGPWFLGAAYAGRKSDADEVVAQCRRVREMLADAFMAQPMAMCAANLGTVGKMVEARRFIAELQHPPSVVWIDPEPMGSAYAGIGDEANALIWYQRALDERSPNMVYLKADFIPDRMRQHPKFQEILNQLNFPR